MTELSLEQEIARLPDAGFLIETQRAAATRALMMNLKKEVRTPAQLAVALNLLSVAGLTPTDMAHGSRDVDAKQIELLLAGKIYYPEELNLEIAKRAFDALNTIGIRFCGKKMPITSHMQQA